MIVSLILAGLVICVLGTTVWALTEKLRDLKVSEAKAWAIVSELRDERDMLKRELRVMEDDREHHRERAVLLLTQVYELRREMGLGTRVETKCFDAWVDGGQPCESCAVLLGVRG